MISFITSLASQILASRSGLGSAKDGAAKKLTAASDIPRNALRILFFMSPPVLGDLDIKNPPPFCFILQSKTKQRGYFNTKSSEISSINLLKFLHRLREPH